MENCQESGTSLENQAQGVNRDREKKKMASLTQERKTSRKYLENRKMFKIKQVCNILQEVESTDKKNAQ